MGTHSSSLRLNCPGFWLLAFYKLCRHFFSFSSIDRLLLWLLLKGIDRYAPHSRPPVLIPWMDYQFQNSSNFLSISLTLFLYHSCEWTFNTRDFFLLFSHWLLFWIMACYRYTNNNSKKKWCKSKLSISIFHHSLWRQYLYIHFALLFSIYAITWESSLWSFWPW